MAARVEAVAKIAHRERSVRPKLSQKTYLAATGPRVIPGFGAKKLPLEGFLFPATYDFWPARDLGSSCARSWQRSGASGGR